MKYPKQLKPITGFIFFSCNRKSGNNISTASVDKEVTGGARIIVPFLQDPL